MKIKATETYELLVGFTERPVTPRSLLKININGVMS